MLVAVIGALDRRLALALNRLAWRSAAGGRLVALGADWLATAEVALLALLGLSGRWAATARALLAVSAIYALTTAAGRRWRRARPFATIEGVQALASHGAERSFPSRHVASAFAMATIATPASPGLGRLMAALAWAMVLTRIGAGLHYPSDVAAGALLGRLVGGLLRDARRCG